MEDSVQDLRKKLENNKQQLKKVKQLLANKENETLRTLKRDLEQVISLTTELLNLKEGKVNAEAEEQTQTTFAPEPQNKRKRKRQDPREWGKEKDLWEIGERCQIKVGHQWELAAVIGKEKNEKDQTLWQVECLERAFECSVHKTRMRTYVIPLVEEIKVGMEVKAFHESANRFFRGMLEDKLKNGRYKVSFLNSGDTVVLALRDLQPSKHNTQKMQRDKDGFWHVLAPTIPSTLADKANDSEQQRDNKRKRRKQIKKEHNFLTKQAAQQNRRHNWKLFQKKITKKSKKKLGTSLQSFKRPSKFAAPTTLKQRVGVSHEPKMTKYTEQKHHHSLKRNVYEDEFESDDDDFE